VDTDANPFAYHPMMSVTDVSKDKLTFIEDIWIPCSDTIRRKTFHAVLDTAMECNAINERVVRETGFKILEYESPRLVGADGKRFRATGQVQITFYFRRQQVMRTWPVKFLVMPKDAPLIWLWESALYRKKSYLSQILRRFRYSLKDFPKVGPIFS
jgi:hypothetical protein